MAGTHCVVCILSPARVEHSGRQTYPGVPWSDVLFLFLMLVLIDEKIWHLLIPWWSATIRVVPCTCSPVHLRFDRLIYLDPPNARSTVGVHKERPRMIHYSVLSSPQTEAHRSSAIVYQRTAVQEPRSKWKAQAEHLFSVWKRAVNLKMKDLFSISWSCSLNENMQKLRV